MWLCPWHSNFFYIQYIPRNMHTVFALLCFVAVIHWLIFPYPSGLLHWHCGSLTIAPVPAKQPWWIRINTSCEFIMNDCITTTKQSTTKPYAYFLGYTVTLFHLVPSFVEECARDSNCQNGENGQCGLTVVSKFKHGLLAQWTAGTYRKGPCRMEKVTSRISWPIRKSTQTRNWI